jgi:putative FmdB family regulatory protein
MPTYEYVCKNCGHLFEIVQSMRDDPLKECPECGGELRKVFAAPSISFKGSGFYATDHGKKSKAAGDGSEGKEKTSGTGGDKKPSSDKGPDKGPDKRTEKGSDKGSDQGSDQGSAGPGKGSGKGDSGGSGGPSAPSSSSKGDRS